MKLFYRASVLRSIAAFFLLESSTQIFAPALSYALTSGPTAPEATNFEPVDTTDMVDLASGDLTYNIPLLEVPGPEGSYPLSLAYHAGIQPNEEASWVGLGWSLNPGAINRNVNGFADDHENINQARRDYWSGGAMSTTAVGLTVGLPGTPASMSFGLSFSQDTYRGFGVGANLGAGSSFDLGPASVGVSASVQTDGYGNSSAGVGVGISASITDNVSGSIGIGLSTSGGFSANAGISAGINAGADKGNNAVIGSSLLGVSMNSGSSTPSLSVGGGTAMVESSKAGIIQTQVSSFGVSIPFPGGAVNIRQTDVRYWSDETVDISTNGSLYFPKAYTANTYNSSTSSYTFDNKAFDTYRLPDPENESIYENPDPNQLLGGSYPDYDNYVVSGQGIAGTMRPYGYQMGLYSQNKVDPSASNKHRILDDPLYVNNKPAFFRFENDFSNQYRQTNSGSITGSSSGEVRYNFDTQPQHGENNTLGYDANTDRIAGSKAIEYYTNQQIVSGLAKTRGFIDQQARGFSRDGNSQIGGFSISNASGVTYHYALPVYSSEEVFYMQKLGTNGGTYNRLSKPTKYAYTWYLTAVTGPDYVDRNNDGLANQGDWGYWTAFNYGKWVSNYKWRNPSEGFHRDADASFESYSQGSKELYYLNSINTRTHTSLFVKSFRADAKGNAGNSTRPFSVVPAVGCTPIAGGGCRDQYYRCAYPAVQLKLDKIITLKNGDVPSNIEAYSNIYNINNLSYSLNQTSYSTSGRQFSGENILDVADISAIPSLLSNSLNSTLFSYNYSLSPGTINSWDEAGSFYTATNLSSPATSSLPPLTGKLTLTQIQTFGSGGNGEMPPTKFGYELRQADKIRGSITTGPVTNSKGTVTVPTGSLFQLGDLIEFTTDNRRICCGLSAVTATPGTFTATYFSATAPAGTYEASTTKNPPYSKDHYDTWGMFKSDFNTDLASLVGHDETMARKTSQISAKNVDVWSLRTIQTPLGAIIKLEYGSDKYRTKVFKRPNMIATFGFNQALSYSPTGNTYGTGRITFRDRLKVPASSLFSAGQKVMISGILENPFGTPRYEAVQDVLVTITSVQDSHPNWGANTIYVTDPSNTLWQPAPGVDRRQLWLGHVKLPENPAVSFGGGIRIEKVTVLTSGLEKTTSYNYENNDLPSGVTSYEPGSFLPVSDYDCDYLQYSSNNSQTREVIRRYKSDYYNSLPKLMSLTRILPAPGAMYEYVTVGEEVKRVGEIKLISPQRTVYQFEVLKANMIDLIGPAATSVHSALGDYDVKTREVAIHDFTARVGRLKRRTSYYSPDNSGTLWAKLNETVNNYLHDELTDASIQDNTSTNGYTARMNPFGYIGMIQETFGDARKTLRTDGRYDRKVVMSSRKSYPVVLVGTTTTDFKTNRSSTTENKQFDFLSGEVTKMIATDGYGNRVLSETTPAYRVYPELGPRLGTNGNRNMLTQSAASVQFKVDGQGNKTGLVSATARTWSTAVPVVGTIPSSPDTRSTQSTIWRLQSTYSWLPTYSTSNGLTPVTGANAYTDYFTGGNSTNWKKTSEVTLYDIFSNALEASDINNQRIATKKGYDNSRVLVTGGPASFNEIAYTGLEDALRADGTLSGGIDYVWPRGYTNDATIFTDATRTTGKTHTGTKSLLLRPYKHGLSFPIDITSVDPNKAYRASVWATRPDALVYTYLDGTVRNSVSGTAQKQANGWYLIELTIPPIGPNHQSFRVACYNGGNTDVYLDDFRVQPINAQTTAYVYDSNNGRLTHTLDNQNLYTFYEYDGQGRLIKISRETLKYNTRQVKEFAYSYGASPPALDDATLTASVTSGRSVQVTVGLPASLTTACTIQYSPSASASLVNAPGKVFTHTYATAGTYWLKVRLIDSNGQQRDLTKKISIQ